MPLNFFFQIEVREYGLYQVRQSYDYRESKLRFQWRTWAIPRMATAKQVDKSKRGKGQVYQDIDRFRYEKEPTNQPKEIW